MSKTVPLEPTVVGSENPIIAFCLTISETTRRISEILKFIKEFQRVTPVFKEDNGSFHKLKCETIIRTDIPRGIKDANWLKVFNPEGKTGIDDYYIFEQTNAPWGSRSMIHLVLKDTDNLGNPLELSKYIATLLQNNTTEGFYEGFEIIIYVDRQLKQFYDNRSEKQESLNPLPLEDHEACLQLS